MSVKSSGEGIKLIVVSASLVDFHYLRREFDEIDQRL
jgi:hypothetical protein